MTLHDWLRIPVIVCAALGPIVSVCNDKLKQPESEATVASTQVVAQPPSNITRDF